MIRLMLAFSFAFAVIIAIAKDSLTGVVSTSTIVIFAVAMPTCLGLLLWLLHDEQKSQEPDIDFGDDLW